MKTRIPCVASRVDCPAPSWSLEEAVLPYTTGPLHMPFLLLGSPRLSCYLVILYSLSSSPGLDVFPRDAFPDLRQLGQPPSAIGS